MTFFHNVRAILLRVPLLPGIITDSCVNMTLEYIMVAVGAIFEIRWTTPTSTGQMPSMHGPTPAPTGPYHFVSAVPNRPNHLAISSVSLSFTIFHACLVGSIAFVIYITHIIYRQSIRL